MPQTMPCMWMTILVSTNLFFFMMKSNWNSFFFLLPSLTFLKKETSKLWL